jgi:ssDNA thymidine ADP-ribosyltransferase, DarT
MRRDELSEFHYITPITNVPSILSRGLLSHRRVESIDHQSVANEQVQARRTSRRLHTGHWLHEYVNLYVWARNAMMYVLICQGLQNDLCVLRISTVVLDIPGVLVTDRNAASGIARASDPDAGIAELDCAMLFAQYWTGDDHKQRMCAEVLVPHRVGPEFIQGVYVPDHDCKTQIEAVTTSPAATINGYLFFR